MEEEEEEGGGGGVDIHIDVEFWWLMGRNKSFLR